jgi:hypothetical protein
VISLGGEDKQVQDGTIEVSVGCDEACNATGAGTLTVKRPSGGGKRAARGHAKHFELDSASAAVAAGATTVLKLKLSKKANRKALAALRHHGRVKATVTVSATDAAGNAAQADKTVRLVRKRKG